MGRVYRVGVGIILGCQLFAHPVGALKVTANDE